MIVTHINIPEAGFDEINHVVCCIREKGCVIRTTIGTFYFEVPGQYYAG
jgi:hypothetical protein